MDKSKFLSLALAIGKVISTDIPDRARVLVQLNRFNSYINTYFPSKEYLESYNPNNHAKVGDLVLIKKMEEPRRIVETHKVSEIVYPAGFITDPMSGMRVHQDRYIPGDILNEETLKELSERTKQHERTPRFSFELNLKQTLYSK